MTTDQNESARQATFLVVGRILATLSEALIPIMLVRLMTATEVGILSGILVLYTMAAPILTAGFPATLMYYLPSRSPSKRRAVAARLAATLLGLGALLGLILVGLGLIAVFWPSALAMITDRAIGGVSAVGPEGLKYLLILALLPLGDLPARMLPNLLVVEGRAGESAIIGVSKSIATALFMLVPISLGFGLWVVTGAIVLLGLLHGGLILVYLRRLYPDALPERPDVTVGELIRFAVPMGLTNVVSTINGRLDQFLIALSFTAAVMAQYRVGAWEIPFLTSVAYSVGSVITPQLTVLFSQDRAREAIELWRRAIEKVSLVVVPVSLVFLVAAEETVELLFTADYLRATPVFRLYCLLTMGRVAAFGSVIVAAGKPRYVFQAALGSFGANLVLSIPALLVFGFVGPAVGTVVAFLPTVVFYCWCISRVSSVPLRQIFPLFSYLKVVVVAGVGAAVGYLVKGHLPGPASIRLTVVAVIVIASFVALGTATKLLTRTELEFVGQWFRKKTAKPR